MMTQQPSTSLTLPLDQVIPGDCLEVMSGLPDGCIDMVFADPPYNLQLNQDLWRPNLTLVDAVDAEWDHFGSFADYDAFTRLWLKECRRVLKPNGTLWVIGTYHNIFRVGVILQDLDYWVLNDVVWIKTNPMPNFRGVRFTNSHETLIWAQRERGKSYTFNHHSMKALNEDLQMRSDWTLSICTGKERLKVDGKKAHPTQKPEGLLYRVILAASNPGDVILDPFFGTGTTGAVAKRLHRRWIGIERNPAYVELARQRIDEVLQVEFDPPLYAATNPRKQDRIPFGMLLENGLLKAGETLYFGQTGETTACIMSDGSLLCGEERGSIHKIARMLRSGPSNGWDLWYYLDSESGSRQSINRLREMLRMA